MVLVTRFEGCDLDLSGFAPLLSYAWIHSLFPIWHLRKPGLWTNHSTERTPKPSIAMTELG